jgi:tryptophan synthase beta subunit
LQDETGQIRDTYSLAPGLDYPGVGPELSYLNDQQRVQYVTVSDQQAIDGMKLLAQTEGIIPALESSHAVAYAATLAPRLRPDQYLFSTSLGVEIKICKPSHASSRTTLKYPMTHAIPSLLFIRESCSYPHLTAGDPV